MPRRDVERDLAKISALRQDPAEALRALPPALKDPVNLVVARAAQVASDLELRSLLPDLLRAFDRSFTDAEKRDPQCAAKTALAKALKQLGWSEAAPFLRGLRHVQLEAVWGGREDSAATLRGTCALALSQCLDLPHSEILRHVVDGLADRFAVVRSDAVQALAHIASSECALLLRLKAHLGDEDARITGEALEALIAIEGASGVIFAAGFLTHAKEEVQDEAALALGASRHPAAVEALIERWRAVSHHPQSAVLLRALGIARDDRANALLLDCLRAGRDRDARAALEALQSQNLSEPLRVAILEALRQRGDATLLKSAQEFCAGK